MKRTEGQHQQDILFKLLRLLWPMMHHCSMPGIVKASEFISSRSSYINTGLQEGRRGAGQSLINEWELASNWTNCRQIGPHFLQVE